MFKCLRFGHITSKFSNKTKKYMLKDNRKIYLYFSFLLSWSRGSSNFNRNIFINE